MGMHQLNVRVDDALFSELRSAYAAELVVRARMPRAAHYSWAAFLRDRLKCEQVAQEVVARADGTLQPEVGPHRETRAERRRLERARREARG